MTWPTEEEVRSMLQTPTKQTARCLLRLGEGLVAELLTPPPALMEGEIPIGQMSTNLGAGPTMTDLYTPEEEEAFTVWDRLMSRGWGWTV